MGLLNQYPNIYSIFLPKNFSDQTIFFLSTIQRLAMFLNIYNQKMSLLTAKFKDKDLKPQNGLSSGIAEDTIVGSMNQIKKRPKYSTNEKKDDKEIQERSLNLGNSENQDQGCWKKHKKCKIALLVFTIIIVITGTTLLILNLTLQPIVVRVRSNSQVQFKDGSALEFIQMTVQDRRFFAQNLQINVTRSRVSPKTGKRFLQEDKENSEFTSTVNLEKQGIVVQVLPDSSTKIYVDVQKITDFLIETDPQVKRLLQQIDTKPSDDVCEKESTDQTKVIKCLEKSLSDQLNGGSPVQLSPQTLVSFKYDQEKKQYVEEKQGDKTLRLLTVKKRLLIFKKIFKAIGKVVKAIVKPVVQLIKVAGPYIGAAVGGTIGFFAAGPAGAWAGAKLGAKLGSTIGSIAQAAFKSCFPSNSLRLRCDGKLVVQNGIKLVAGFIAGEASKGYVNKVTKWMKF